MSLTDLLVIAGLVVLILGALTWLLALGLFSWIWRKAAQGTPEDAKSDRKAPEGPFDLRHPSRGLHRRP